ncbi:MAG: 5-oxoprolinase subunit B family protein [Thiobacillus sp.]
MAAPAGAVKLLNVIAIAAHQVLNIHTLRKAFNRMAKPQAGQPQSVLPWRWMGERGLRVETGAATLDRYAQLVSQDFAEFEDIIPADGSILLILKPGAPPPAKLAGLLAARPPRLPERAGRMHVLPLRVSEDVSPDLAVCAARAGLDARTFVRQFAAIEFTVAFLGFQPGFPYLAGLPGHWAMPRRATPRVRVPAGSVALGGGYAGVYPMAGPGGWHVVGQTDAKLFDPARAQPALLAAGDRVCFEVQP